MNLLMDTTALRKRIDSVYSNMRERAKPPKFKSGPNKGKVKGPGLAELPFNRQQLWDHANKLIGPTGVMRCPYCVEIGRPAFVIDLINCVFDHKVPLGHGGTWDLWNLFLCCADCNNCKGKLSYEFFIGIMAALEAWTDPRDRTMMHSCMRTHGVTQRLKGFHGDGKKPIDLLPPAVNVPPVPRLPLRAADDDW